MFYCTVDPDATLRWANEGHCTPFLIRQNGEMLTLGTTGMPLGMLDGAVYGVDTLHLEGGDKIVAYTDGLTEAQNGNGQFFGVKQMRDLLRAHTQSSAAEFHDAMMGEVDAFIDGAPQHDDITALVIEFRP